MPTNNAWMVWVLAQTGEAGAGGGAGVPTAGGVTAAPSASSLVDGRPSGPATTGQPLGPAGTGVAGGGAGAQPQGLGGVMGPVYFAFILVALLFLMTTLAGRKDRKRRAELLGSLKKGDRVVTGAGIIGTIHQLKDDELLLEVDPNSRAKLTMTKASVTQVLKAGSGEPAESPEVTVRAKGERAAV